MSRYLVPLQEVCLTGDKSIGGRTVASWRRDKTPLIVVKQSSGFYDTVVTDGRQREQVHSGDLSLKSEMKIGGQL